MCHLKSAMEHVFGKYGKCTMMPVFFSEYSLGWIMRDCLLDGFLTVCKGGICFVGICFEVLTGIKLIV